VSASALQSVVKPEVWHSSGGMTHGTKKETESGPSQACGWTGLPVNLRLPYLEPGSFARSRESKN
jgi:hypothetical protein